MPGVSIRRNDGGSTTDFEAALDAVCFFDDYDATVHYDGDGLTVASTGYDGYPVRSVDTDEGLVVFEGFLYDTDDTDAALRRVASWVDAGDTDALESWVRERDGDFLAVVVDEAT